MKTSKQIGLLIIISFITCGKEPREYTISHGTKSKNTLSPQKFAFPICDVTFSSNKSHYVFATSLFLTESRIAFSRRHFSPQFSLLAFSGCHFSPQFRLLPFSGRHFSPQYRLLPFSGCHFSPQKFIFPIWKIPYLPP
jgi:hypothetical protein